MQLQALMLALFMMILIPIFALSANHNSFFLIVGLILFFSSLNNTHKILFGIEPFPDEQYNDMDDHIESEVNLDLKRFEFGTKVVKNLIIVLFLIYCTFYIGSPWLLALSSLLCLYWIADILLEIVHIPSQKAARFFERFQNLILLAINTATMILIVLVTFNKFVHYSF